MSILPIDIGFDLNVNYVWKYWNLFECQLCLEILEFI